MGDHSATKFSLDGISLIALLGWANNMLPAIATIFTILWTALRCYEAVLAIRQKKLDLRALEARVEPPPPTSQ